jgi:hypothetical protein
MSPSNRPGWTPELASSSDSEPVRPQHRKSLNAVGPSHHESQHGEHEHRHFDRQEDAGDVSLSHLVYADKEVKYRPVLRSDRAAHKAPTKAPTIPRDQDLQSDDESTPTSKATHLPDTNSDDRLKAIPAGPNAISALRKHISANLLAKLPDLRAMKFSRHNKPSSFANLRLLLGTYTDKSMNRWDNPVYAYMRPNVNLKIGPNLIMEVEERHEGGGHDLVRVTWKEAVKEEKVAMIEPFKQTATEFELPAVVKYYFLLAVEAAVENFHHDFIPLNRTFVQHLTGLCLHYVPDLQTPMSSVGGYKYDQKSPSQHSKTLDRRRSQGYEDKSGVAKVQRFQQAIINSSAFDPGDNGNEDQASSLQLHLQHSIDGDQASRSSVVAAEGSSHRSTGKRYNPVPSFFHNDRSHLPRLRSQRDESATRNLISSWLGTINEEMEPYMGALPDRAHSGERLDLNGNWLALGPIDQPLRRLRSQNSVYSGSEDMNHVSRRNQSGLLSGINLHISSFSGQSASNPSKERARVTYYAMSEPTPDGNRPNVEWRRFRAATSSLPGVQRHRRERRASRRAEQSPNLIANRRPSSTFDRVVSPSLLQHQKRVIDSRVDKNVREMDDRIVQMRKLRRVQTRVDTEIAEAKRRKDEMKRLEDEEMKRRWEQDESANDSTSSRFMRWLER